VKRAASDEIRAGSLEGEKGLDHVDDVDAVQEILDEGLGNHGTPSTNNS
jgi:hypothetical protein